jgi:hypothetical protein
MMEERFMCPCCGKEVGMEHFACKSGEKGGRSGRGEAKARSSEQARAAVRTRWDRERKAQGRARVEEMLDSVDGSKMSDARIGMRALLGIKD